MQRTIIVKHASLLSNVTLTFRRHSQNEQTRRNLLRFLFMLTSVVVLFDVRQERLREHFASLLKGVSDSLGTP